MKTESTMLRNKPLPIKCPICKAGDVCLDGIAMFRTEKDGVNFYKVTEDHGVVACAWSKDEPPPPGNSAVISMHGNRCGHRYEMVFTNADIASGGTIFYEASDGAEIGNHALDAISYGLVAAVAANDPVAFNELSLQLAWQNILAATQAQAPVLHQWLAMGKPSAHGLTMADAKLRVSYEQKHLSIAMALALTAHRALIEGIICAVVGVPVALEIMVGDTAVKMP